MDIKKIFSALLIVGFLMYGGLAVAGPGGGSIFGNLPQPTQQQTCHLNHDVTWLGDRYSGNPCDCRAGNDVDIEQCAACCMANTVMNIVQWTFYIMIILASFFLLVGAYHIMSAGGNPDKITY